MLLQVMTPLALAIPRLPRYRCTSVVENEVRLSVATLSVKSGEAETGGCQEAGASEVLIKHTLALALNTSQSHSSETARQEAINEIYDHSSQR